jgi:hypothetical protein
MVVVVFFGLETEGKSTLKHTRHFYGKIVRGGFDISLHTTIKIDQHRILWELPYKQLKLRG